MSAKLLSFLEFKHELNNPKKIPWGFSTVYVDSGIKLIYDEWINLMLAFDQLDSDSRLDAAIVSLRMKLVTRRKNIIMTLNQFSDRYPLIYEGAPLGFFSVYKKEELTKEEWIDLMESFRKLTVLEKMALMR